MIKRSGKDKEKDAAWFPCWGTKKKKKLLLLEKLLMEKLLYTTSFVVSNLLSHKVGGAVTRFEAGAVSK